MIASTRAIATLSPILLITIFISCNSNRIDSDNNIETEMASSRSAAAEVIKEHMKEFDIPGMQIAISLHEELVWTESFGYADIENKIPVTNSTTFRLGSVSKSLTSAAIGVLLQQNKLNLNAPVDQYVPSFPKKRWPITIAQLAGHTSGIRHYISTEEVNSSTHYSSVIESLKQFSSDSLLFEPGTQVEYSSFGYTLLSAVIESVSKKSFPTFMEENVFSPLKMNSPSMDYNDRAIPERSKFYVMDDKDRRVLAPLVDNSNKWAAGGMISTAEDLAKFGSALLSDSFLPNNITSQLFSAGKTKDGNTTDYGIGWQIKKDATGRKVIFNDGSLPSARAFLFLYPDEQMVLSILINTGSSVFFNKDEAMMLADLFLQPLGNNPNESERKTAKGIYTYTTLMEGETINGTIEIFEENGSLKGEMTIPNQFFKERKIAIRAIRVVGDEISMIGIPGNWIALKFTNSNGEIKGSWRFGPINGELTGRKNK